MNLIEAAQMALNALDSDNPDIQLRAATHLRAALAQQEQVISQEWQPANPDAKLRHFALVLRDLDKTIEGWCEQPEFYLDGKRIDVTQQEPVAWWHDRGNVVDLNVSGHGTPLYFAPPQREWQGLTDEERQECLYSDPIFGMAASTFARAIEAKLKEKNT